MGYKKGRVYLMVNLRQVKIFYNYQIRKLLLNEGGYDEELSQRTLV